MAALCAVRFLAGTGLAPSLFAEGLSIEEGIYSNTHSFLCVLDGVPESKTYKTFNTFYYDGSHPFDEVPETPGVAQVGSGLYLDFYVRYEPQPGSFVEPVETNAQSTSGAPSAVPAASNKIGVWVPGGNLTGISVNNATYRGEAGTSETKLAHKKRLVGYAATGTAEYPVVYEVPYWLLERPNSYPRTGTELAALVWQSAGGDVARAEEAPQTEAQIQFPKFIRLNGDLYTCVTGTGSRIRNARLMADDEAHAFLAKAALSGDGQVLALGEPLYTKTTHAVSEIASLIQSRNSEIHPPHFFLATPKEPAIYQKLAEMQMVLD